MRRQGHAPQGHKYGEDNAWYGSLFSMTKDFNYTCNLNVK